MQTDLPETATCGSCGFHGHADEYHPSFSPYHDLRCPMCGTTNVDTSKLNAAWKAGGREYGFGDNNTLDYAKIST